LLDPEYGLEAARRKAKDAGLLLAYESDGYENPRPHRMLALLPGTSAAQLRDNGADAIKILLSWTPEDDPRANDEKRALVARIGDECEAANMPFLLEPVVYDPAGSPPRSLEFAKRKPDLVVRTMEEFSKPVYKVDILKVEYPVIAAFVESSPVYKGEKAQSHKEALDWFRAADSAAGRPYIYLSAGAEIVEFLASLEMAAEAGSAFSGVLCGRAMWQDGIPHYARGGEPALNEWLETEGVGNAKRIAVCLKAATPWHKHGKGAGA
jgi:tagatose 1,6-diphosphate aldolase